MEGPINYNIDVKNPFEEYAKGLQLGNGIRQLQNQQAQEAQMAADMNALSANPTADGILKATLKYPAMREQFESAYKMLPQQDKQAQIKRTLPVFMALQNNNVPAAVGIMEEQISAFTNSGMTEEAAAASQMLEQIKADPKRAAFLSGTAVASVDPDTFAKITKVSQDSQLFPLEQQKLEGERDKAVAVGENAAAQEALKNANLNSQIGKRNYDKEIAKWTYDLKATDSQLRGKIGDEKMAELRLKQQQLNDNISRATQDRDAEGQTALANNEDLTKGIEELLKTPPEVMRQAHGPADDIMPTFREPASNYKVLVDVVKSKVFLNQIQNLVGKGAGSLSDTEGAKLEGSLRSLSMKQSAEQMRKGLTEILPLLSKANSILKTKYAKTPTQGGAAPSQEGDIEFIRGPDGRPMRKPSGAK